MRYGACVCSCCGSTRVQMLDWIDPNSGEVVGGNDCPSIGEQWCDRCEENHRIDWIQQTPSESLSTAIREHARELRRQALREAAARGEA